MERVQDWELRASTAAYRAAQAVSSLGDRISGHIGLAVDRLRRLVLPPGSVVEIVEARCSCARELSVGQRLRVVRPVEGYYDFVLRDDDDKDHYVCPVNFRVVRKPWRAVEMPWSVPLKTTARDTSSVDSTRVA